MEAVIKCYCHLLVHDERDASHYHLDKAFDPKLQMAFMFVTGSSEPQ